MQKLRFLQTVRSKMNPRIPFKNQSIPFFQTFCCTSQFGILTVCPEVIVVARFDLLLHVEPLGSEFMCGDYVGTLMWEHLHGQLYRVLTMSCKFCSSDLYISPDAAPHFSHRSFVDLVFRRVYLVTTSGDSQEQFLSSLLLDSYHFKIIIGSPEVCKRP